MRKINVVESHNGLPHSQRWETGLIKDKKARLEENPMKVHYDREQDILYLAFKE